MNTSRSIDQQSAQRFLQTLEPGCEQFVFQTFDDSHSRKNPRLARTLIGTLEQLLPTLNGLQSQGAGVFVQVQGGEQRGKQGVTYGRAVFVDADQPEKTKDIVGHVKKELPPPSIVIISSAAGKMHMYWATEAFAPDQIGQAQDFAADVAGTDASMSNTDRVMRLPGSWHQKDGCTPFQVKLQIAAASRQYNPDHLVARMAAAEKRGAIRPETGQSRQMYDPVFGLPITDSYEEITALPEGGRTQPLVSHIGKRIAEGYSAEFVEREVREMAATLVPEGHAPISEAALQQEILPAIGRFEQTRWQETYGDHPPAQPQPQPTAPPANVPGMPEAPTGGPTIDGAPVIMWQGNPTPPAQPPPVPGPDLASPDSINETRDVWEEKYIYVEEGQQIIDSSRPLESGRYKATDFEKAKKNCKVGDSQMFNKWLSSPRRKTVRDMTFRPGGQRIVEKDKALYYNTYDPPEQLQEPFNNEYMDVYEDHMMWLFQDVDAWQRMVNWMAITVQRPDVRVPWAPLLVSVGGTGKTWVFECMKNMLDGRYCASVDPEELEQQYNSYMADTLVVWFEEVHTRQRHEMVDKLKPIITNNTMEINNKYGGKGQREVYANVGMTSNHDDALALKPEDLRRYWVYRITRPICSPEYGKRIYGWLDTAGPKHALHMLRKIDISSWAFNAEPPVTDATKTMIRANMSLASRAVMECIEDRVGVFQADCGDERQIERTVAQWLDQDLLDKRQKSELQHLIRHHSTYIRRIRDNERWVRVLCWRRQEFWDEQSDTRLHQEYERAKAADLGQPLTTNHLSAVEGGKP